MIKTPRHKKIASLEAFARICRLKFSSSVVVVKTLSCKIFVSVLIALASFYAVSTMERSFQLSVVPNFNIKIPVTRFDELYEIRFFIYNNGWTDRTLTGIELDTDGSVSHAMKTLRTYAETHPLTEGQEYSVNVNGPSLYLMEMKKRNYPMPLPKQAYTEIVLDKASSLRFIHSNRPITLLFDKQAIKVTKNDLGYNAFEFQGELNGTKYKGDVDVIERSLTTMSTLDRLLKLRENECVGDVEYLLVQRDQQIEKVKRAKIFNKTERYKKLKDLVQPYFASYSLMFLNFFCESTEDPIHCRPV